MSNDLVPQNSSNKELKEFKFNSTNPFIKDVMVQITETKYRKMAGTAKQHLVNPETGEVTTQTMLVLGDKKRVDQAEFTKVYSGSMQKFFGLSKTAWLLFEFIMDYIKYNDDKICLYIPQIIEDFKVSKPAIYRAIKSLLNAEIIARADTFNCYYINPNLVFKGDRITLIQQYELNNPQALKEPDVKYGE